MNILELDPTMKRNGFRDFLLQRNPSESFDAKYLTYLTSSLVRAKTKQVSGQDNIYTVSSVKQLDEIYHLVKCDSANIRLHNIYSGVVSAYIKYISGSKLRKMVMPTDN